MDPTRFDALARNLAAPTTRRGLIGTIAALGGGLMVARAGAAQVSQAQCGNVVCASNPGKCSPGCVCCVYPNGNSRCRPPGTCSPSEVRCPAGQVLGPSGVCIAPTTTTTAAPTTTTTTATPTTTTTPAPTTTTTTTTSTTTSTTTAAPVPGFYVCRCVGLGQYEFCSATPCSPASLVAFCDDLCAPAESLGYDGDGFCEPSASCGS